jgi:hypothetical protein
LGLARSAAARASPACGAARQLVLPRSRGAAELERSRGTSASTR